MVEPVPMAEVWRGGFLECVHRGHAVIADASGGIVRSWGEPELVPQRSAVPASHPAVTESGGRR